MNLIDIAVGAAALVVASVLSVFTGGFSFFLPWIIWGSTLLFVAGLGRHSRSSEAVWPRVLSINLCWLIALVAMLRGTWWVVALSIVGIFVPTTAGILVRRALNPRP